MFSNESLGLMKPMMGKMRFSLGSIELASHLKQGVSN